MGGVSSERAISLRSGKNVAEALEQKGYCVKLVDITSENCRAQLTGFDIAYNILHGRFGEDGGIQKILEELKIPYTGSGVKSSANCMDKLICKNILIQNNLPTPAFTKTAPAVVKAPCEGSSIGVTIVKAQTELDRILAETIGRYGPNTFAEEYTSGAEVTVGVMPINGQLTALPILELIPKNEFYDFEAKYTPGKTEFILPARLSPKVTEATQELAIAAYRALRCDGAVRVDFVVEERQKPTILEINTVPGMTDQSDLPAEAKAYGIDFPDLVEMILLSASQGKW